MDQFQCQSCHARLQLTGVEALRDVEAAAQAPPKRRSRGSEAAGALSSPPPPQQQRMPHGGPAVQMDESFVVLDGGHRGAPAQHEALGAGSCCLWQISEVVLVLKYQLYVRMQLVGTSLCDPLLRSKGFSRVTRDRRHRACTYIRDVRIVTQAVAGRATWRSRSWC